MLAEMWCNYTGDGRTLEAQWVSITEEVIKRRYMLILEKCTALIRNELGMSVPIETYPRHILSPKEMEYDH